MNQWQSSDSDNSSGSNDLGDEVNEKFTQADLQYECCRCSFLRTRFITKRKNGDEDSSCSKLSRVTTTTVIENKLLNHGNEQIVGSGSQQGNCNESKVYLNTITGHCFEMHIADDSTVSSLISDLPSKLYRPVGVEMIKLMLYDENVEKYLLLNHDDMTKLSNYGILKGHHVRVLIRDENYES